MEIKDNKTRLLRSDEKPALRACPGPRGWKGDERAPESGWGRPASEDGLFERGRVERQFAGNELSNFMS